MKLESVEVAENFASNVSLSGLIVVHDTLVGGEDDVTELSGREDLGEELLEVLELEVESGRDDTDLVDSSVQVDDDLSVSSVVNDFEVSDVSVSLHNSQELDNSLGNGSQEYL